MRRRRRKASVYHTYLGGQKKKVNKKVLFRIIFIIGVAVLFVVLAVAIGNRLDRKAEDSLALSTENTTAYTESPAETEDSKETAPKSISDASELTVRGADIPLNISSEDARYDIDNMYGYYNAVSVRITDESGTLLYSSPALLSYARLPGSTVVDESSAGEEKEAATTEAKTTEAQETTLDTLKTILSYAKAHEMRTCAVYTTSSSVLEDNDSGMAVRDMDKIVTGELYSFGFNEVIIGGIVPNNTEFTSDTSDGIIKYIASLREVSGDMDIGITLPSSVYLDTPKAAVIKTISEYADLLAISISGESDGEKTPFYSVYDGYYSLKGNFSTYNIRSIITSGDAETSKQVAAALNLLYDGCSLQFSVYISDPSYEIKDEDKPTESSSTSVENPNVLNTKTYEDAASEEGTSESVSPSETTEP